LLANIRHKTTSAVFVSLDAGEAVASRLTKPRGNRRERKGQTHARRAGGVTKSFSPCGGNLSQQERQRLDAWLVSIGAGYGDSLYIDEPAGYPNVAVRDDIARVAADYGLALGEGAPVLNGEVPPGTIRVIASRSTASVPSCPDWSEDGSDPASAELTSSNFGCAMNSNLAAMVAHPDDLIVGRDGTSAGSGTTATRAVGTYRRAQPTGSQPLPSTSTTTGNQ